MTDTSNNAAPITRIAPDTVRVERVLDAPAQTVWRYLTEAKLRQTWFMGGTDMTGPGPYELYIDHDLLSDGPSTPPDSYRDYAGARWTEEVTRFDPPRLLQTTFNGGKDGHVTYELVSEGDKTRLILTHSGISGPERMSQFGGGWTSHTKVLEERLAGRGMKDFWSLHAVIQDAVTKALA